MMANPLVSVCMPCRNAAPYVPAAIDSVLAQTYREIELVVVDDGSTDGGAAILDKYAADHGVRVFHEDLGSAAKARNLAFRHCRGDYVKFFDADDLLSPEMVERQVARIVDEPGCIASSGWVRFHDDPSAGWSRPDDTWQDLPSLEWLLRSLRDGGRHCMMLNGMFLFPRALIEEAGAWDEQLTLIDDLEFHVRMLVRAERILYATSTLNYRSGLPGSLSAQKSRAAYESAIRSTTLAIDRLRQRDESSRVNGVCADLLQALYFEVAPLHSDLGWELRERIEELGGSEIQPSGGPVFHVLTRLIGWRVATRLRAVAIGGGYTRLRSYFRSQRSFTGAQ